MYDYTFNSISIVRINPHRLRNTLIAIFSILFVVILLSSLSANKGIKTIHESGSPEVYPFGENTVSPFSSVSFFSSDRKVLLKGWFFRKDTSKKIIIFVHDYSGNRNVFDYDMDAAVNYCLDEGYCVLLFDQRNSGNVESSRTTLGLNERYDVEGALSYSRALDMREIYIVGIGAGANAVINAQLCSEVKACVLDSPYYDLDDALRFVYKDRKVRTVFFTKTFTKIFLRMIDKAKMAQYGDEYFTGMPDTLITRSGFSYLDTNEEKKIYDAVSGSSQNDTILAAIQKDKDPLGYLDTVFAFFDDYTDVEG